MAAIRHSIIAAIALCSRVASRKQKVEDFIVRRYDSGINFYFRAIIKEISRFRKSFAPKKSNSRIYHCMFGREIVHKINENETVV